MSCHAYLLCFPTALFTKLDCDYKLLSVSYYFAYISNRANRAIMGRSWRKSIRHVGCIATSLNCPVRKSKKKNKNIQDRKKETLPIQNHMSRQRVRTYAFWYMTNFFDAKVFPGTIVSKCPQTCRPPSPL
jgi:hypothetical protein